MYKRKLYDQLLEWKKTSNGTTAALIEGARRVGKTTLVKEFAKCEYDSYIFIDFQKAPKIVMESFDDLSSLEDIFLKLQTQYNVILKNRKSAIVFDEVQHCPRARAAIKYLVADGRYDYIETGSLISIHQNIKNITIPSEEKHFILNPLDYEEFLWAINDEATYTLTKKLLESPKNFEDLHRKLMQKFRLYMLIGGMPQAITAYINSNNFLIVDEQKRDILNLYNDDLYKIDSYGKLTKLFNAIPAQLNKPGKYHTSSVIGSKKNDDILKWVSILESSKTVIVSHMVNDPNVGMSYMHDLNKFKLYLFDTGLFITLMFMDRDATENIIYKKLLHDKLSANLGYLYENIVAQMLTAKGDKLFYNTMYNDKAKKNYEIDFLISRKNKICPIEVKSSNYLTHKSLDVFCKKYHSRISEKYLVYNKYYKKQDGFTCMPPYLVPYI